MSNMLKVWFNPEKQWFEVFTVDGQQVYGMQNVAVDDRFKSGEPGKCRQPAVTLQAWCEVVNERPTNQTETSSKISE